MAQAGNSYGGGAVGGDVGVSGGGGGKSSKYWLESMHFQGSNFTNASILAWMVFTCLAFLVVVVILIVSSRIPDRSRLGRRAYGNNGWGVALVAMLL